MLKMGGGERTYMGEVVAVLLPQKRDRFQCCEFCLPREGRAPAQCVLAPDEAERLMRLINRGANVRPVALCSRWCTGCGFHGCAICKFGWGSQEVSCVRLPTA